MQQGVKAASAFLVFEGLLFGLMMVFMILMPLQVSSVVCA
jgi:hypothetical protein